MKKYWLLLGLLAIILQYFRTRPTSIVNSPDGNYDFIIVGGGTAGCLLAALLSEDKTVKVLLIEAGNQFGYSSNIPIAPTLLQRSEYDWSFETKPQKYSSIGLNDKKQYLPRGKGLGGSGQINYMLHETGLARDFDNWEKLGASGWGSQTFKSIFKIIFAKSPQDFIFRKIYKSIRKMLGFNLNEENIIYTSDIDDELVEITKALKDATSELDRVNISTKSLRSTINNGLRTSTLISFLNPALQRPNLHVILNSIATKIVFRSKIAVGVEVMNNGIIKKVLSKSEVILSAGSLKTPQLLLLSGIGPKSDLESLNIPVVSELPGVGSNLHDHLNMPIYISLEKPISVTVEKIQKLTTVYEYLMYGTGYISSPGVTASVNVNNETSLFLFAMGSVDEPILREIANYQQETFRRQFPFYYNTSKEGFLLLSHCMQPYSRGTVKLKNLDPVSPPLIDPRYLADVRDIRCTIKGLRTVEKLINTISFKLLKTKIHWPMITKCVANFDEKNISDDYLECIIRHGALTAHHVAGTCSMGGENKVVDSNLNVIGVEKLKIVDASVFPTPVSSPPNSVIIALAYRAAEIIKKKQAP